MKRTITAASLVAVLACLALSSCATLPRRPGAEGAAASPEKVEGGYRFSLYEPKAKSVAITGDFNTWSKTADPLTESSESKGLWSIVLPLAPGRYEYKFLVNGERWIPDPGNPERVKDGFDGQNSVIVVP